MSKEKYLMVDLETLDTSPSGVILSAGLVQFDLKGNTYKEIYKEYDVVEQLVAGRTISKGTQEWWVKDKAPELRRLLEKGACVVDMLPEFVEEMLKDCEKIISRGSMDIPMLEDIGVEIPYWKVWDCRILDVFGKMDRNSHNALEDCKNQIDHMVKIVGG